MIAVNTVSVNQLPILADRLEQNQVRRAQIVLSAAQDTDRVQIARELEINVDTARMWRDRWVGLQGIDLDTLSITERLHDAPRPGAPTRITIEQPCQIAAIACEAPAKARRPIKKSDRERNRRRTEGERRCPSRFLHGMPPICSKKGTANCSDRTASDIG